MEKRYQVFISSTYDDLQHERQQVVLKLLELGCIPSGMELFPAANDDQWTVIKRVIDECDYYIAIVGGCYGSTDSDGISYTEREYRYALDTGKPILAFLHKDPGQLLAQKTEETTEGKERLQVFRKLCELKLVKYWNTGDELASQVVLGIVGLRNTNPGIGWVRGDTVPDESVYKDIVDLRKQVDELKARLATAGTEVPEGTQELAQGEDEFELHYSFAAISPEYLSEEEDKRAGTYTGSFTTTWNAIASKLLPLMIRDLSENELDNALGRFAKEANLRTLKDEEQFKEMGLDYFSVDADDFLSIIVQLRALGLITESPKTKGKLSAHPYWVLTDYGETILTKVRAIRRPTRD